MEKKEKKCIFAFGNQRRAPLYERQALFIRKAHQTTQVLHARMLRTLSLEGSKTVRGAMHGTFELEAPKKQTKS